MMVGHTLDRAVQVVFRTLNPIGRVAPVVKLHVGCLDLLELFLHVLAERLGLFRPKKLQDLC